jgi:predicted nucleotidyltransferase
VPFISVPALVLLKMVALHDRPLARHKKDAADIGFVIRHYLDIGNRDRLKTPPDDDIMSSVDGDADLASAVLLGRDIRAMTTTDSCDYLRTLLDVDTESQSRCYLARGLMGGLCKGDFSRAKAVLKCVRTGLDYDGPITINA